MWNHFTIIPSGFSIMLQSSLVWFLIPGVSGTVSYPLPKPQLVRIAGVIVSRSCFTQDLTALTYFHITDMNALTNRKKSQCFWSNLHHMHLREDEFGAVEVFYPCFDQAFSFLLFQRFLCMCCGFVPEFCGEATTEKNGSFCIFCWICVSDRKGMSNRLGEHSSTVMLSRITTWTHLVAMDNS